MKVLCVVLTAKRVTGRLRVGHRHQMGPREVFLEVWGNGLCGVRHDTVRDHGNLNYSHDNGNGQQGLHPVHVKEVESPVFGHWLCAGNEKGLPRMSLVSGQDKQAADCVIHLEGHYAGRRFWKKVLSLSLFKHRFLIPPSTARLFLCFPTWNPWSVSRSCLIGLVMNKSISSALVLCLFWN